MNSAIPPREAKAAAHRWAVERGKDPRKFTAFAEHCLTEYPGIMPDQLETQLRYFDDACTDAIGLWKSYSARQWELQAEWTIETVKHLAIVNGGGVAGAATLLSGEPTGALKAALLLFTFGLVFAVLDFYLNSVGYQKRAVDADGRARDLRGTVTWSGLTTVSNRSTDPAGRWFPIAECIGWLSALLCLAGVACLIYHLVR